MANEKLRRQIAFETARLMVAGQESDYYRAGLRAARRVCGGWVKPDLLPSEQEIRNEISALTRMPDGGAPRTEAPNRFDVYRALLAPLETVQQHSVYHPEGDALYHSLQVFQLARAALAYDEEFQLAALLHDVGKGIDPRDHIQAALRALDGHITPRTAWLIEHHSDAGALLDGRLGQRAKKRLESSENFDDLMLLCRCDRQGRETGVKVPEIDEALAMIRELDQD